MHFSCNSDVKGAHEGQGLGNAFLSNIKAVDGIFHLCRAFDDADVIHVEGDLDPVRDLQIIHEELRLKDVEFLSKLFDTMEKEIKRIGTGGNAADKKKKEEFAILSKVYDLVSQQKKDIRDSEWTNAEIDFINPLQLLTAKPVVYLCNLSIKDYTRKKNRWLPKIKSWIDENHPGDILIPFSGALETEFAALETDAEKEAYLKEISVKYDAPVPLTSVLPKIIVTGYQALQLIYCNLMFSRLNLFRFYWRPRRSSRMDCQKEY